MKLLIVFVSLTLLGSIACGGGALGTQNDFEKQLAHANRYMNFEIILPTYLPFGMNKSPQVNTSKLNDDSKLVELLYESTDQMGLLRISEFNNALPAFPLDREARVIRGVNVYLKTGKSADADVPMSSAQFTIDAVGVSLELVGTSNQSEEDLMEEVINIASSMINN